MALAISLSFLAACNSDQKEEPSPTAESASTGSDGNEALETADPAGTAGNQAPSSSQSALQYSEDGLDIVFSGGGAKSIAQIGALKELEEQGIAYRRVVGTSSGSIMALMVAAGYSADEMAEAITERTPDGQIILASFMDVPAALFRGRSCARQSPLRLL